MFSQQYQFSWLQHPSPSQQTVPPGQRSESFLARKSALTEERTTGWIDAQLVRSEQALMFLEVCRLLIKESNVNNFRYKEKERERERDRERWKEREREIEREGGRGR
jgi:hypothetical protein